jgi:hypothetical protein
MGPGRYLLRYCQSRQDCTCQSSCDCVYAQQVKIWRATVAQAKFECVQRIECSDSVTAVSCLPEVCSSIYLLLVLTRGSSSEAIALSLWGSRAVSCSCCRPSLLLPAGASLVLSVPRSAAPPGPCAAFAGDGLRALPLVASTSPAAHQITPSAFSLYRSPVQRDN